MPNLLVELAVPLAAAALVVLFLRREYIEDAGPRAKPLPGTAVVRKVNERIYLERTGQVLTRLWLEVRPESGDPYPLWHVEWYIFPASLALAIENRELAVRIDPRNPKLVYPAVDWARRR